MDPMHDHHRHHLAAILFADIVGYSSLSARDHAAALRLVGAFQATVRGAAQEHEGRVVKFLGDGALLEFASSAGAVRAARAIADRFAADPPVASDPPGRLRIGVHVGEVAAAEDDDLYGDGVNVAARLQQAADPGAIWVSEDVWRQLRAHSEFRFVSCGDQELRGQSGPIRAYRLESEIQPEVRSSAARSEPEREIESLAVLPFANMSADPEQEYFSDGIAEELLDAFAKIHPLRVAARTSSFQFKGQSLDVREVGRKLGVAAVLEGSVRKSGSRVRITAQLIGTADGFHLWSDRYDRELDDVFAVQEEIAQSIVGALKVRLPGGSQTLVRQGTEDVEAYGVYLRGRHAMDRRNEAGLRQAVELFEKAIARDPAFAGAFSGLADVLLLLWNLDFAGSDVLPRAREAAEKALRLDDGLGEAHATRGVLLTEEHDWAGAERELRRAIALSPSYVNGHLGLTTLRTLQGRLAEALDILRRAEAIDPLSRPVSNNIGFHYLVRGEYEQARDQARRVVELDPGYAGGHQLLAIALAELGERHDALGQMQRAIELDPGRVGLMSDMAWVHAATGDGEAAREWLGKARESGVSPFEMAQAWMRLGETEAALACLDEVDPESVNTYAYSGLRMGLFDPVRADPRYRRHFERFGLSPDPLD